MQVLVEGQGAITYTLDYLAAGRLVLLARGPAGYRSLCRLSTLIQGGPERERRRPLAGMDGDGFFLGDGETFITVRGAKSGRAWDPMLVHGRWRLDEWGGGWLQAARIQLLK